MSDSDLEKEVKQIKKDLEDINKKIDLVIEQTKEKDSMREALKDSYQLFVAGLVGAISGVFVDLYVKYPSVLFAGIIFASIAFMAIFFSFMIRLTFRKSKAQKS